MLGCSRYVITENIARFEALLRGGGLDDRQAGTVTGLLAQACSDLVELDRDCAQASAVNPALSVTAAKAR